VNSLTYKDFKFLLSNPGRDSIFRFMTMSLMGEVNEFKLSQQADTSNYFIVSNVFFKNKVANSEFFEKKKSSPLNNFRRVIDGSIDLNMNGKSKRNSEIRVIGNDSLRTSKAEISFVEISDNQFEIWSDAVNENQLNGDVWNTLENKFPNSGHCSLSFYDEKFCHIGAYIPTRIFETLWSEIESQKLSSIGVNFRFHVYTDKSEYSEWGESEGFKYFIPPSVSGYDGQDNFGFDSSSIVGGELTGISFSRKYS